ncbi:unnamed protein product, partial [Symbiodinium sp. CCMP2456]
VVGSDVMDDLAEKFRQANAEIDLEGEELDSRDIGMVTRRQQLAAKTVIDADAKKKAKPTSADSSTTKTSSKKKKTTTAAKGANEGGEPCCAPGEMAAEPLHSELSVDAEADETKPSKAAAPKVKGKAKAKAKAKNKGAKSKAVTPAEDMAPPEESAETEKAAPKAVATSDDDEDMAPAEESPEAEKAAPRGRKAKAKVVPKATAPAEESTEAEKGAPKRRKAKAKAVPKAVVASADEETAPAEESTEAEKAAPKGPDAKLGKRKSPVKPDDLSAETAGKRKSPVKPNDLSAETAGKRKSPVKPNDGTAVASSSKRARTERLGDCKIPMTFARRYMPEKPGFSRARWQGIRNAFNTNIHRKLDSPSKHEDLFWKFCINDWCTQRFNPTEENMGELALDSSISYLQTLGVSTIHCITEI